MRIRRREAHRSHKNPIPESWLKVLFTVLSVPVFWCQESVNRRLLFSCFPPQQQLSGKDEICQEARVRTTQHCSEDWCWSQARLAIFRPVELTNFRTYKNSQCTFSFRFTYYLMVIIHQLLLLQFHICFHDSCFL